MKRKQKQIIFEWLSVLSLVTLLAPNAFALADITDVFVVNMPTVSGVTADFESRYHLNLESLQNQGENFNVSSQKGRNPQVSLFFNPTDPKPGNTVEAKAFPNFFANKSESLYFTWYLKRRECDLSNSPSSEKQKLCDWNDDGKITVEDWKIEAMRTIASNDFDYQCQFNQDMSDAERLDCADNMYNEDASSRTGTRKGRDGDKDGYIARFGGDRLPDVAWCYVHDAEEGINYELPACKHLFTKNYKINSSGNIEQYGQIADSDGSFFIEEEHFWKTDPEDPSTAQNGNKDEANLAGLGQSSFKWIYDVGDKVGVAVEGLSMYNTKHDDSTNMVMWALPKDDCDVVGKSSYSQTIKGYSVTIPTATTDINDCIPQNLIDPSEGGQPGNLNIILSASPEKPSAKLLPDSGSPEETAPNGDLISIQASTGNAEASSDFISYSWRVEASKDGTFNTRFDDKNVWEDITETLLEHKNISATAGNNLSLFTINLNLNEGAFSDYFNDGVAYFRITTQATENFFENVSRSGRGSLVVKIVSNKVIDAYDIFPEDRSDGSTSVHRNTENLICNNSQLEFAVCPVMKNQIIGLSVANPENETRNYAWALNGTALTCNNRVSTECADEKQGNVNFFPVTGEVGDTFTISVIANNAETGKSFTITRTFQVVNPDFDIVSNDQSIVWPKYLGKYVNLDGSETENFSRTAFESTPGSTASLSIVFRPKILGNILSQIDAEPNDPNRIAWTINGQTLFENTKDANFVLDGEAGANYSVLVEGTYSQPRKIRKALYDIWGISPFNSDTLYVSKDIQIGIVEFTGGTGEDAKKTPNTFFASVVSAIPTSVLFSIRLIFTIGLILLTVSVIFSLAPGETNRK